MVTLYEPLDLAIAFRDVNLVERSTSEEQQLELWRHPKLGLIFTIGGEVQHVEAWQALYHEPLVHLPAAFVPEVKAVLILGGGSLFAAAQVLQYPSVVSCTLVDHDPAVLDLVGRHYCHARRVLSDTRFKYVRADIMDYIKSTSEQFDLSINDGIDTLVVSLEKAFSIHSMMQRTIGPHGVCADVIYRHLFDIEHGVAVRRALENLGNYVLSPVVVPEYPGVLHMLTIWGNSRLNQNLRRPINAVQRTWCKSKNEKLEFFDPRFLAFSLFLPPYVRRAWAGRLGNEGATKTQFL